MIKSFQALFLSLVLAVTSIGFAVARGQNPDVGTDMVICTGVGMIVMKIGPDGKPVEETVVCPDAISVFATAFYLENPPAQVWKTSVITTQDAAVIWRARDVLTPVARGPPLEI